MVAKRYENTVTALSPLSIRMDPFVRSFIQRGTLCRFCDTDPILFQYNFKELPTQR